MVLAKPFRGIIDVDIRDSVPDWGPYKAPESSRGTPNVLMIVWDDVGMAAWDTFGGLIEMPVLNRLSEMGLRYANWHTTALCSPTRSCLLTGRNCHLNGMAVIEEATSGFPGKHGHIPFENGLLSEILVGSGYNTYCVGKWHLCPAEEMNLAAVKRNWPVGRGFERFYGFLGGETNQWYPTLVYDNHPFDQPYLPEDGYHLSKDLVDRSIEFIKDSRQIVPDKPFFLYLAPGACHAPHHVWKEWADKYKGKFDMGYEKYREIVLERMKKLGVLPENTALPPVNPVGTEIINEQMDYTRPWDSLSVGEKRLFARMAEVYAGFCSYTDHELGRLIDYLEETGEISNTIIVVLSDNGASGEGGPDGSVNENLMFNSLPEDLRQNMRMIDELGSPDTFNHYANGWAMAFNTPFKMWKRYSYNGGICDPLVIVWPSGIKARGEIRHQYHHAIDIMPTILDCCGIRPPEVINGYTQSPIQGVSMSYTFESPDAPTTRQTQYYEMLGTRGVWHRGWKAVTRHAPTSGKGNYDQDVWELYYTDEDRSEAHDLADQYPDKLKKLVELWWAEAGRNNVLPLDDRVPVEILIQPRPQLAKPRNTYVYYPDSADIPEGPAVNLQNRSFTMVADLHIDTRDAEGVIISQGSRFGGYTLYIKDGRLHYEYNFVGQHVFRFISDREVPTGHVTLGVEFSKQKEDPKRVANGPLSMFINDRQTAGGPMKTQPGYFGLSGGGLRVGRDGSDSVSQEYRGPFRFTRGRINSVTVSVSGKPYADVEKEAQAMFSRQ
ncbi:MAG TPA: sulfatase-like hydrolase/transferase [Methanocella sp.]|nr:sulfatase-like hydrolase/transferase [Methanocella sp.]